MARPKTEYRNEIKSRVSDRVYEGLMRYQTAKRCASEARAISDLLEIALFGMEGSFPFPLTDNCHQPAFRGPEMTAHK